MSRKRPRGRFSLKTSISDFFVAIETTLRWVPSSKLASWQRFPAPYAGEVIRMMAMFAGKEYQHCAKGNSFL
jgi:hypothetical protein